MGEKTSEKEQFDHALLLVGGMIFMSMIIVTLVFLGETMSA
ncbi:hypothetical protein [Methanofollis formosanus]|nr:hypothetical protein [Methanofollis formosanus]